jgi:hypothetical protein
MEELRKRQRKENFVISLEVSPQLFFPLFHSIGQHTNQKRNKNWFFLNFFSMTFLSFSLPSVAKRSLGREKRQQYIFKQKKKASEN